MIIREVRLYPAKIPRKYPFKTSRAVQNSANGIFIEIVNSDLCLDNEDPGVSIGTGESAPRKHITGETLEQTLSELELISNYIIGEEPKYAWELLNHLGFSPAANLGMEMALLDLISKQEQLPLCDFLSNKYDITESKPRISYCGFANSDASGEKFIRSLKRAKKNGFNIVRIKAGELSFDQEYGRISYVRRVLGNDFGLWLDVNQAWTLEQAKTYVEKFKDLNIMMLEQPLIASDYEGHRKLKEYTNIPIMLDESVQTGADLDKTIDMGCADAVNLKIMKLGSFEETKKQIKKAKAAGLQTYCGATTVTDIFAGFARHIEFALPELDYFTTGKPRSGTFVENPTQPKLKFTPLIPYATRPVEKGIGININHNVLDKYIVKEFGLRCIK